MNQIQELPARAPGFGYEFNYAVWTAGTSVTLCNVPWNSDYRDIVRFDSQTALDSYVTNQTGPQVTINNMTYAKPGHPVRVNMPFNRAYKYNYLRAINPTQPIPGNDEPRAFYYFITNVNYVAPNTTELMVQLDVWQTFGYGITFGNCYIERGHVGIANENQFSDNGRTYLTIPEGLDVGSEYQIVSQWTRNIATARNRVSTDTNSYSVLVTSTVALDVDPGTIDAPSLHSAKGSQLENLPNGAELYVFATPDKFKSFMEAYSDKPWITQGIISIQAIPYYTTYGMSTTSSVVGGVIVQKVNSGSLNTLKTQMQTAWRDQIIIGPAGRYQRLKKFLVHPYTTLEVTAYTGTPLSLKPESWSDAHATMVEVPHFAAPGARLVFYPYRYNAAQPGPDPVTDAYGVFNDGGEFLDVATGIFNFPTFSLVNNGYLNYMAANTHGIAYQHSSADWSQQRALAGNQLGAEQATSAIGTSQNINQQGISATQQSRDLANTNAAINGVRGGIAAIGQIGSGPGGVTGAASGIANAAIDTAMSINTNNMSTNISNNLSMGVNRAQNDQAGYMRDSNRAYADMATNGDYQNAVAGINARVQDAKLIQPTTSGQLGGDASLLATYKWGYDVKVKMLQAAAMSAIGEYWLRYGYQVNRFGKMPSSFQVMDRFTYWKLKETYITASNCPETFKQTVRGIFEKGVTVWKNPTDIGNIDIAQNNPLEGVTL